MNEDVDVTQNNNSIIGLRRDDFIAHKTSTEFAINDDVDDVHDDNINDNKEFYFNKNEDYVTTNNFKDGNNNNNSKKITDENAPTSSFFKSTTTSLSTHHKNTDHMDYKLPHGISTIMWTISYHVDYQNHYKDQD